MEKMQIRVAKKEDIFEISRIYQQGTSEGRSYDFPDEPWEVLLKKRKKWFLRHDKRHPIFVAEIQEKVVGWISLQAFDERKFLQHVGEASVYVHQNFRGNGIGSALFQHLFSFAKKHDFQKIIVVSYPDNPILHLEERLGFVIVGTYKQHVHRGKGEYEDLHILEKYL